VLTVAMLLSVIPPGVSFADDPYSFTLSDLEVNHTAEPLGVDDAQPVFSWRLSADAGAYDKAQSAYQVVVSSTEAKARASDGDVWDSGKTVGENNYDIVYGGIALSSKTKYWWAVRVWDEDGTASGWSAVSTFETGIYTPGEWGGDWIGLKNTAMTFDGANWIWRRNGANFSEASAGTEYFRKSFTTNAQKSVSSVYIGVSADDAYELYLNGEPVGTGNSWYTGTLYDVTSRIDSAGANVIAASATNALRGYAGLLVKVEITYSDGTKTNIVTDTTWKVSTTGPAGWNGTGFDDTAWSAPDQVVIYGSDPWNSGVIPNPENGFAATVLRKDFTLDKPVKKARAYVAGLGYFEMKINGALPDDTVLNPDNTQYTQTVSYRVFDVTDLLQSGANAVGVELGNSFYNETVPIWNWHVAKWRDAPKLRLVLDIELQDGTTMTVATDESWKATKDGPLTFNSVYYGEYYDARKELGDYAESPYDDSSWGAVQMMDAPNGTTTGPTAGQSPALKAQVVEPMRRLKTVPGSRVTITPRPVAGSYVLTVPEMLAGWINLKIDGADPGDLVTITYGQRMNGDQVRKLGTGTPNGDVPNWYPMGYNQQDKYTCKGTATESFEPKFSFKSYQYIQIDGYPGTLTTDDITCYGIGYDIDVSGSFTSSDAMLNQLHQMMLTSIDNNMKGKFCDPMYEKNGWLGDANVALDSMMYNYDLANMMTHFTEIMEDCQNEFGWLPVMAPTEGWSLGVDVVTWTSLFVLGVEQMITNYGSEDYMREQYDAMRVMALRNIDKSRSNGWTWANGDLSDWVAPVGSENSGQNESSSEGSGIVGTGYAYRLLDVMAQFADRLGKASDAAEYRAAMANMYDAFNAKFYNAEEQIYETTSWSTHAPLRTRYRQTSQLVPLAFGLVPDAYKDAVLANLVKDIKEKGDHLDTGIVGAKLILPVLSDNGYGEVAYKIAQQTTYPSWGFMTTQLSGTSLWETWETTTRTLDHYFLGTYDEWFYSGIGGIKNMKEGYKTVTIEPIVGSDLTFAKASVDTVRGPVHSEWTRSGSDGTFTIKVPVGTTATVLLPQHDPGQVELGGQAVSAAMEGIRSVDTANDKTRIVVGSGTYQFEAPVEIVTTDKSRLKALIAKAETYQAYNYDATYWAAFGTKLNDAKAVRDRWDAAQTEIDIAHQALADAITDLEAHANVHRQALKDAVAGAPIINPIAHPINVVAGYQNALAEAKAGCVDPVLTDAELDALKDALSDAIDALDQNIFVNLAEGKTPYANSTYDSASWGWGQVYLTDGDRKNENSNGGYSGYSSSITPRGSDHVEWVYVDLGGPTTVNAVSFYAPTDTPGVANSCYGFPKSFDIQVSDDAQDWRTVVSVNNYPVPSYGPLNFTFETTQARYVRLYARNLNPKETDYNYYYLQLTEMEVYYSHSDIDSLAVPSFTAPVPEVADGEALVADDAPVVAHCADGTAVQGVWSAADADGEAADVNNPGSPGEYTVRLTFTAPPNGVFDPGLAGTAGGAAVTVEAGGNKLVYAWHVTVEPKPLSIVAQPQNQWQPEGGSAVFVIVVEGTAPSYRWQIKKGDTWEDIPGAASPTFTVSGLKLSDNGKAYRCVARSDEFDVEEISGEATLGVLQILPSASVVAGNVTVSGILPGDGHLDVSDAPEGYTIVLKSSSHPSVIATDGAITPSYKDVTVELIFEVTKDLDGDTALTAPIRVTVPPATTPTEPVTPEEVAATIPPVITVLPDRTEFTMPAVPDSFEIFIANASPSGVISEDGGVVPPLEDTDVSVVFLIVDTRDGSSVYTAPVTVAVKAKASFALKGIVLSPSHLALNEGDQGQFAVSFYPVNTTDAKGVSYSVVPAGVLSVAADGSYTALKGGSAVVTARSSVGGYQSHCTVTVQGKGDDSLKTPPVDDTKTSVEPLQSLSVAPASAKLGFGSSVKLTATVAPAAAAAGNPVSWASSDPGVATVSADGTAKGVGEGTAIITATAGGKQAVCELTVMKPVTKILTPLKTISLKLKAAVTLPVVSYGKAGATAAKLAWASGNPSVATVDAATGKITAKKAGTAKVTATALNGKALTVTVKVAKKAKALSKVTLTKPPKTLKKGKAAQLRLKVSPSGAAYRPVVFRSSKPGVVAVDKAGTLTALKKGKAVITVKVGSRVVRHSVTVK
jgi:uncharacterized protein YjdB